MSRVRKRWLAAWGGAVLIATFGRLVQGESWEEMLAAYNLREGELWPLVLAWLWIGPEVVRRLSPPRISPSPS